MQEEVAEDMVKLARSLKNNAVVAKDIIKNDNKVQPLLHERSDPVGALHLQVHL